jgi:hypothetical protein
MKFIAISALFALAFAWNTPNCASGVTGLKARTDHLNDKGCLANRNEPHSDDKRRPREQSNERKKRPGPTVPTGQRHLDREFRHDGSRLAPSRAKRPYYGSTKTRRSDSTWDGKRSGNDGRKNDNQESGNNQGCIAVTSDPILVNPDPILHTETVQVYTGPAAVDTSVQDQGAAQDQGNGDQGSTPD